MSHYLIDMPARVALFPVLVAQALQVRRRALKLPEAAGPRQGAAGSGPDLRLLVLGDSSAAGVGARHQDEALAGQLVARLSAHHRVTWRLEARTGATTRAALDRVARLEDARFDVAVVALGVNDVTRAVPLPVWMRQQRRLIHLLTDRFGVRRICLSGLPPMGEFPLLPHPLRWVLGRQATRFDRALSGLAADHPQVNLSSMVFDLDVSHMAEDGFHPGPEVYAAWAKILADQIIAP
ncbi:SGNH/GDSL hydrolase family protein [Aestuariivita sp.]|jgi:lysophospholipase L1-like esterase|uniref:SGNH/GDSL hydrolase family protein n=1 Tax=Aestuariivita sp. TaxID=1872407 RepID=UPI00216C7CBF|nr:SGNH/GDSL hydrolase family protein [Aestuariivita sp.]MCE8006890.1 SGNH/GDSL hydrolase family protein [Aestuariivita sp.]